MPGLSSAQVWRKASPSFVLVNGPLTREVAKSSSLNTVYTMVPLRGSTRKMSYKPNWRSAVRRYGWMAPCSSL